MNLVYALVDPRSKSIRYIGQSSRGIGRAWEHGSRNRLKYENNRKSNWIRQLLRLSLMYRVSILQRLSEDSTIEELNEAEIRWIAVGREHGWPLTNSTTGGKGARGFKMSAEECEKRRLRMLGSKLSPETRAKIGAKSLGRKQPRASVERRVALRRGIPLSPETKAKLSASIRAAHAASIRPRPTGMRWKSGPLSPEHKEKIRAANLRRSPEELKRIRRARWG